MPRANRLGVTYQKANSRPGIKPSKGILRDGNKLVKRQHLLACRLCSSSEINDFDLGELLTNGEITVHYFCLLLASGLYQNGKMSDKKAIKGFLKQDILKEIKRGSRLKCCFCRGKGATIGCCMSACKRVFHLPCGRAHSTLHLFFDTFGSFCELHRPEQSVSVSDRLSFRGTAKATCTICLTAVDARSSTKTIRSPCCKNAWFHHVCMQTYAISAGQYFFKCPVCSCVRNFQNEMLSFGIYIPVQKFDLILCDSCGSFGTHKACRGLTLEGRYHLCPVCSDKADSDMKTTDVSSPPHEENKSAAILAIGGEGRVLRSQLCKRPEQFAGAHHVKG